MNFQSLNRHLSVLLNLIAFQLDREEIKGREDGERGGGGAIIQGRRVIEGGLFKEIRQVCSRHNLQLDSRPEKQHFFPY